MTHVAVYEYITHKLLAFMEAGRVGVASTQTEVGEWVIGGVRKAGN